MKIPSGAGTTLGGYSPPTGPLLCPTRGDAQSGTGGGSDLWPSPVNPHQGTLSLFPTKVNKTCTYRVPLGGVGGGGPSNVPLTTSY